MPIDHVEDVLVPALFPYNVFLQWTCCFFEAEGVVHIRSDNVAIYRQHNVGSFMCVGFEGFGVGETAGTCYLVHSDV